MNDHNIGQSIFQDNRKIWQRQGTGCLNVHIKTHGESRLSISTDWMDMINVHTTLNIP